MTYFSIDDRNTTILISDFHLTIIQFAKFIYKKNSTNNHLYFVLVREKKTTIKRDNNKKRDLIFHKTLCF